MLSGWLTTVKLACPVCMEESKAFTLKLGHETSFFNCQRHFLLNDHQYSWNKNAFVKNRLESSLPPLRLDGDEVWRRIEHVPKVIESGQVQTTLGYGITHNWTKQSIF